MSNLTENVNDTLLSLFCGLALLAAARAFYAMAVGFVPDALLLSGGDPLARLAAARLILFALLVGLLTVPLSWPLARYATKRTAAAALPGAACAFALFLLLERAWHFDPFPSWLDFTRAVVLFAALPTATALWWRKR